MCTTTYTDRHEPCTYRPSGLFRQWLSPHQIKNTQPKNCASTFFGCVFSFGEAQCLSVYDFMSSRAVTYHCNRCF